MCANSIKVVLYTIKNGNMDISRCITTCPRRHVVYEVNEQQRILSSTYILLETNSYLKKRKKKFKNYYEYYLLVLFNLATLPMDSATCLH